MLDKSIQQGLNNQITMELYSAYLYGQMAAYFESKDLRGFSHWMKVQAQEEIGHGMILFNFVCDRGGEVELGQLDKPPHKFESPIIAMKTALEHEEKVSASINKLYKKANEANDLATKNRLEWFIEEQVEEEATPQEIIARLELAGDDGSGLFMIDQELEQRQFQMPEPLFEEQQATVNQ